MVKAAATEGGDSQFSAGDAQHGAPDLKQNQITKSWHFTDDPAPPRCDVYHGELDFPRQPVRKLPCNKIQSPLGDKNKHKKLGNQLTEGWLCLPLPGDSGRRRDRERWEKGHPS